MSSIYVSSYIETRNKISLLLSIEQARMTGVMEVSHSLASGALAICVDWIRLGVSLSR